MKRAMCLLLCVLTVSLVTIGCSTKELTSASAESAPEIGEKTSETPPSPSEGKPGETPPSPPEGKPGETPPSPPEGKPGEMPPAPPGGMQQEPDNYAAVITIEGNDERNGEKITSTGKDENVIHIASGTVSLKNMDIQRVSEEGEESDAYSFFGTGAAVLSTGGKLSFEGGNIETDALGGAGLFAYKDGVITAADCSILTRKNLSGGIHVAGGGKLTAENVSAETYGRSSAAIRSDRGGGYLQVSGGKYVSYGDRSPAIYCTADIEVEGAYLEAKKSEGICIEGRNSLSLKDCTLISNMPDQSENDSTWSVIVYQSMSGDSEIGKGTFRMSGGKLISQNGGLFYTTNTESEILLSNVAIEQSEDSEYFLACLGNANERGWGATGANGAKCAFTADNQSMRGNVLWDQSSELRFTMQNGSELTGAFLCDNSFSGESGTGYADLYISENSKWIVTENSRLSKLENKGTIVDADGNSVSIIDKTGNEIVKGESIYHITID